MSSDHVSRSVWRCSSMHDPDGRRGIWFKLGPGVIAIRGGREGDDAIAVIHESDIGPLNFKELCNAMSTGAWMQECYGPDTDLMPGEAK